MTLGPAYPGGVTQAELDEKIDGPAGATDNAVARYDGATGKKLKDSPNLLFDGTGLSIGTTRDPSAILDAQSASLGFLPPKMTTAERDNITSPATGLEIFNITTGEPENFSGSVWVTQGPTPAENLAATLAVDNETGGNNIVITDGDAIVGAFGTTGAPIIITGGFGDNAGGPIFITSGLTDNGPGADWTRTAGPGGTEGGNGPGGDIIDVSGSGNSNNQKSGDLHYKAGNPDGSGAFGDMFLQEDGGNVIIGTTKAYGDKLTTRKDSSSSATNIISAIINENTTDNNWSEHDFKGLSSTSAVFTGARIGIQILDHNNSTKSADFVIKTTHNNILSERFRISDGVINVPIGILTIDGNEVSTLPSFEFEIFEASDLDKIDAGDVITVDGTDLVITLMADITSVKRFNVINGSRLTIRFAAGFVTWTYSGTDTFLTGVDSGFELDDGILVGTSSGTLFDITGGNLVSVNEMSIQFWGSYGTINGSAFVLMGTNGFFVGDNATLSLIDNAVTSINNIGIASATPVTGAIIRVSGDRTQFFDWSTTNVLLQSGESFIRFDPFMPNLSGTVDKVRAIGGELFDTTAGSTGTFTVVADASIGPQSISVVSDAGGIASFNFTPGPVVFVGQEITISGYVTNTAYNGTFIISDAGVGVFEIAEIPFGTDEASGSFTGDSITLTDTATTLSNGDTLVIDCDENTDYDGGAVVYNKQTNSFEISRTFTSTQTGSWDTAGIDQTDPRVLANNNPGHIDSKSIAFTDQNGHTTLNNIVDGAYIRLEYNGLIERPSTERFKLISTFGVWEYTGNEPFEGLLTATIFAMKTGATANYRFTLGINGATPNFANSPYTPMEVKTSKIGVTMLSPLSLVKGDTFEINVAGDGTSDMITPTDLLLSVQ